MTGPNFTRWKPAAYIPVGIEILVGWPGASLHMDVAIVPDIQDHDRQPMRWHIRDTVLADETVQPPTHWQKIPGIDDERWQPMLDAPENVEIVVGWRDTPGYIDFATFHTSHELDDGVWRFRHNQAANDGEDFPDFWMQPDQVPD